MFLIILMLQCLDVQMLVRLLVNQLVICCILLFVFGWRWKTDVLLNFLSSFLCDRGDDGDAERSDVFPPHQHPCRTSTNTSSAQRRLSGASGSSSRSFLNLQEQRQTSRQVDNCCSVFMASWIGGASPCDELMSADSGCCLRRGVATGAVP